MFVQVALYETLKAHGVVPSAIVGHSVGEVAAAYAAGVFNLADAVTLIYHRSRLQVMLLDLFFYKKKPIFGFAVSRNYLGL